MTSLRRICYHDWRSMFFRIESNQGSSSPSFHLIASWKEDHNFLQWHWKSSYRQPFSYGLTWKAQKHTFKQTKCHSSIKNITSSSFFQDKRISFMICFKLSKQCSSSSDFVDQSTIFWPTPTFKQQPRLKINFKQRENQFKLFLVPIIKLYCTKIVCSPAYRYSVYSRQKVYKHHAKQWA